MCLQEKVYKYLDNMTLSSVTSSAQIPDPSVNNFNCNAVPSVIGTEESKLSSKTAYEESYCSSEYEPSESLLNDDQEIKSGTDSIDVNKDLSIKKNNERFKVSKV